MSVSRTDEKWDLSQESVITPKTEKVPQGLELNWIELSFDEKLGQGEKLGRSMSRTWSKDRGQKQIEGTGGANPRESIEEVKQTFKCY